MKRKFVAILTLCLIAILSMVGLVACSEPHEHSFTQEVESQAFVKTPATCDDVAVYYKSCSCGEKGTETFNGSAPLGHAYGTPSYVWEGTSCTATRTCANDINHVETETVTGTYVKDTDATCGGAEKGHYKAVFVVIAIFGEHESEVGSISVGEPLPHAYGEVSYSWDGESCTATHTCSNDSNHFETETVVGVYVTDTYATCTEPEKGHYLATFTNPDFATCQTDENSFSIGEPTGTHVENFGDLGDGTHGMRCESCKTALGTSTPHTFENYICTGCQLEVTPSSGLEFSVNVDRKSYSVSGLGTCTDKEIVIPYTYNGFPVTEIGDDAFKETDIKGVTILNNITTIGGYAFYKCASLEYACLGDNVTTINSNAFYQCTTIKSIIFPKNLQTIHSAVFWGCTNLSNVSANDNLITITGGGYQLFEKTAWYNNDANWDNGVIYLESLSGNSLYLIDSIPNGVTSEYAVKDKTRIIASYSMGSHTNLTSVILPDSLVAISSWAFNKCTSLATVSVGDNILYLNETSIFEKTALITNTDNYVDGVLYLTSRSQNTKYLIKALTTISGNYKVEENTKVIAYSAFNGCANLTGIELPNGLKTIGGYAFNLCTSLKEVTIPDSIKTIETYTFNGCEQLTTCVIGNGVKTIYDRAFGECTSLKNITFGSSVEEIFSMAFYHCNNVESLIFPDSLKIIGKSAFEAYGIGKLKSIKFGTGIERIERSAFGSHSSISSISYSNSSTSSNWYKLNVNTYKPTAANVKFESTTLTKDTIDYGYLYWYRMPDDSNFIK